MISIKNQIFSKKSLHSLGKILLTILFFIVQDLYLSSIAHGTTLEEVEAIARSGDHAAAEVAYDKLLEAQPGHLKIRLARAHVRSWQGHHKSAQNDYLAFLKAHPKSIDALVGLAYSYAWSGDNGRAEERFQEVLRLEPTKLDAQKGAAYNALWAGKTKESVQRFQGILKENAKDIEAILGLAQAFLSDNNGVEAKKTFNQALGIAPENSTARQGLEDVRHLPPNFDVSLWVGHTSNGGESGLRTVEVSGLLKRDLRLWARYDNALSLDNPGLVREGREIPSYFIGVLSNWGRNYTTRLEIGTRDLGNNVRQNLYQGEHVVYLSKGHAVKFGGFMGPKDGGGTDWNLYTGLGIPLRPNVSLSPTVFYTKTGGVDETEWRILVPVEYRFSEGWRVSLLPLIGEVKSVIPGASGTVWGASTLISAPFQQDHEGHLLIRYEAPASAEAFTVIALGFTFKLGRD